MPVLSKMPSGEWLKVVRDLSQSGESIIISCLKKEVQSSSAIIKHFKFNKAHNCTLPYNQSELFKRLSKLSIVGNKSQVRNSLRMLKKC